MNMYSFVVVILRVHHNILLQLAMHCKFVGSPSYIIIAVVYIFISLYDYIFPVPRIVATALNI